MKRYICLLYSLYTHFTNKFFSSLFDSFRIFALPKHQLVLYRSPEKLRINLNDGHLIILPLVDFHVEYVSKMIHQPRIVFTKASLFNFFS